MPFNQTKQDRRMLHQQKQCFFICLFVFDLFTECRQSTLFQIFKKKKKKKLVSWYFAGGFQKLQNDLLQY